MAHGEEQYKWFQLSPKNLEHRVRIPTAITLHKLVPKPFPVAPISQAPSVYTYKHLSQDEIEKAQAKAKRLLMETKLSKASEAPSASEMKADAKDTPAKENENDKEARKASPARNPKPIKRDTKDGVDKESKPEPKDQAKRPTLAVHRGIGESALRTRQITRLAQQIPTVLKDLETSRMQPPSKEFVTPHETDVKKKRWEDFLRSAGRSLFSLKREIFQLERTYGHGEKNNGKTLRGLASATRTLHKLLLALKTHAETALMTEPGKKLYAELLTSSKRLFEILVVIGIKIPKVKFQTPTVSLLEVPEDSSTESELATSDVDSDLVSILHPNFVRERIASLADQKLNKKRRKKQGDRRENHERENDSKKKEIIINLLEDNKEPIVVNFPSQEPKQQDSPHGKRVTIASGPKPKLKRRPKYLGQPQKEIKNKKKVERETEYKDENFQQPTSPHMGEKGHLKKGYHMPSPKDRRNEEHFRETEREATDVKRIPRSPGMSPRPLYPNMGKLVSEKQLVERTADAVVSRLIPIIGQESKEWAQENVDDSAAPGTLDDQRPSLQDKARQIEFLLDRVCTMENEWKKAQDVAAEITKRMEKTSKNTDTDLQAAIDRAKRLMDSVGSSHKLAQVASMPIHKSKDGIIMENVSDRKLHIRNPFLKPGAERVILDEYKRVALDDSLSSVPYETDVSLTNLNLNEDQMPTSENIADQIKRQKEEFWESLIKRGFIKPQDINVEGAQAVKEVVEMILQNKEHDDPGTSDMKASRKSVIVKEDNVRTQKENQTAPKARVSVTNTKRNQTLSKVCQEAQVGASLLSYSSSFVSSSTQDSQSSRQSFSTSGSYDRTRQSSNDDNADHLAQLSDKSNDSSSASHEKSDQSNGSESFPSYDGIS